ncbi:12930_t:CDS:2, partial [Dentiscutata heterogama]
ARDKALRRISGEQQKQKERHDRQLKATIDFEIGEKVLVLDARKLGTRSHKLTPKWKGLYYIHSKLPNGAYKLREVSGNIFFLEVSNAKYEVLSPATTTTHPSDAIIFSNGTVSNKCTAPPSPPSAESDISVEMISFLSSPKKYSWNS